MKRIISIFALVMSMAAALAEVPVFASPINVDTSFYPGFKKKAVLMSYDDGSEDGDAGIIKRFDAAGMKGTFNINYPGSTAVESAKVRLRKIYQNHEIANHTLKHPSMSAKDDSGNYVLTEDECIETIKEAADFYTEVAQYPVVGFAWPYAPATGRQKVLDYVRNNCLYARNAGETKKYSIPSDFYNWDFSFYQMNINQKDELLKYLNYESSNLSLMSVWGHGWEYRDGYVKWTDLDDFVELYKSNSGILWNPTCSEYVRYMNALDKLQINTDTVYNPSDVTVYLKADEKEVILPGGYLYDGEKNIRVNSGDTNTVTGDKDSIEISGLMPYSAFTVAVTQGSDSLSAITADNIKSVLKFYYNGTADESGKAKISYSLSEYCEGKYNITLMSDGQKYTYSFDCKNNTITLNYTSSDNPVLNISLSGEVNTGFIYAAWFDSELKLKSVKKYPASDKIDVTFGSDEVGDYGKVMWWDANMQPMSDYKDIPLK